MSQTMGPWALVLEKWNMRGRVPEWRKASLVGPCWSYLELDFTLLSTSPALQIQYYFNHWTHGSTISTHITPKNLWNACKHRWAVPASQGWRLFSTSCTDINADPLSTSPSVGLGPILPWKTELAKHTSMEARWPPLKDEAREMQLLSSSPHPCTSPHQWTPEINVDTLY